MSDSDRGAGQKQPRTLRGFHVDRATVWRLARFIVTGGIASGVYAIAALVAVDSFAMSGIAASTVAYMIAIPISFIGQKFWTFRAKGAIARELPRFLGVQLLSLIAASLVMGGVVDVLGWDRLIGIAAVISVIPVGTYLLLSRGVFAAVR